MIDFSQAMRDLNGKEIADGDVSFTLGAVACNSLLATFSDEGNLPGTKKAERFSLAMKIHGKPRVGLKAEEVALLKMLIGKAYAALIVGQAWLMLDPPEGDE